MLDPTRKTLHDLINYIPGVAIPSAVGFLSLTIYTRLLLPQEYGIYTLAMTSVSFAEMLCFSWLNQSTLRYFEKYRHRRTEEYLSTVFWGFISLALLIMVLWVCVLLFLISYRDCRFRKLLVLGPLLLLLDSGSNLLLALLRAMRESQRYSTQRSVSALLKLALGVVFVTVFGCGAEGILAGVALAGAYVFLTEISRVRKRWKIRRSLFRKKMFYSFAKYGGPLVALAIMNLIIAASDRYFIAYFLDAAHVGVYSAGYKLAETGVLIFASMLMLPAFPALIECYENGGENTTKLLMRDILSFFIVLMVPVVFGISVLSKDIISVALGESYFDAWKILPWVSLGVFFFGLGLYFNKSFELKEKTILLLYILLAAALTNLVLNFILIPIFGNEGAAVSTCCAYCTSFGLSALISSKFIRWEFPWRLCFKVLLACIIMSALIHRLPDLSMSSFSLLYKASAGFLLYVTLILLFERKRISNIWPKIKAARKFMPGLFKSLRSS